MKQYSFKFNYCTRAVLPESCKDLKGQFRYDQIPDKAFSQTVMKRLKSAMDCTTVWIRKGYFNGRGSWCSYGIKVIDLEQRLKQKQKRLEAKKKAASVRMKIINMEKDKAVKKYIKLKSQLLRLMSA